MLKITHFTYTYFYYAKNSAYTKYFYHLNIMSKSHPHKTFNYIKL